MTIDRPSITETAKLPEETADPPTDDTSERAVEGMLAAAGSWRAIDTEELKADIRRWREEGSRPKDRP